MVQDQVAPISCTHAAPAATQAAPAATQQPPQQHWQPQQLPGPTCSRMSSGVEGSAKRSTAGQKPRSQQARSALWSWEHSARSRSSAAPSTWWAAWRHGGAL